MVYQIDVGERISQLLLEKKMRQQDLAKATGLSNSAISTYISGKRQPSAINLAKIASALCTTTQDLLTGGKAISKEADMKLLKTLLRRNVNNMSDSEKRQLILMLFEN